MIVFNCSGCGRELQVPDDYSFGQCPLCGVTTYLQKKRTSKITILFRVYTPPALVGYGLSWVLACGWVEYVVLTCIMLAWHLFWWGGTNLMSYLGDPEVYREWKKGGGDPWFDTLPCGWNNDPDEVRYQELYRMQAQIDAQNAQQNNWMQEAVAKLDRLGK